MLSRRYLARQGQIHARQFAFTSDDVLYCPFPLFHADATALTTVPALLLGATAAISRRFSASRFWAEVRETRATVFDYMGATLSILHRAEPRPDDADNPVRVAWGVPLPEWAPEFERRFGLELVTLYGSVEANICVTQPAGRPRVPGACGRAGPEFDVRIHDPQDRELAPGEAGEIVVRPRVPSIMLDEYFGNPDATAAAFRNLWFHTGDVGSMDADGNLYFIGRANEAIRRRGENISAFEVEEGLLTHPDIVECAAIGVPSELTEEDVKVCVVRRAGSELQPDDVIAHAQRELARFQVPRYVEFVDALPKTPTGKVAKHQLARDGRNPATWDREAAPVTSSHNVD
jgi:crotonobetaine/carnitine-CoA ligase